MAATNNPILILGAGISGLAAAQFLAKHGKEVIVLEAADRVGGRIRSIAAECGPVEMGAEFIHGGNADLRRLLRRAGMKVRPVRSAMRWQVDGVARRLPDFWDRLIRVIDRIDPRARGQSIRQFFDRHPEIPPDDRRLVAQYLGGFEAAPLEELSARGMIDAHAGADSADFRPAGPYAQLPEFLANEVRAAGGQIRLSTTVESISWRRGRVGVRVRAADGARSELIGVAAIVTFSLGVLRAGTVRFRPALKEKRRIWNRIGWGHVVRVGLEFRPGKLPAEWRRRGFGFVNGPGLDFPTWWAPTARGSLLVGWAGGKAADHLAKLARRELRARALRSLSSLTGAPLRRLEADLAAFHFHDWQNDPLVRGAYSFVRAGAESGPRQLARPVAHTLFFAGEATGDDAGTVHGALSSGLRAARAVAAARNRP